MNNITDKYYQKYIKYKLKYNNLKNNNNNTNKNNNLFGGVKYDCHPENKFADICIEKDDGQYKTKERCINDCETKYIRNQLQQINIAGEVTKFYLFIKDIIKNEKLTVYLKGGNVLGLKVLKMIYDKYKSDDKKFKEKFNEFLKLDLIKDWDFSSYTKNPITPEYREKMDDIAKQYQLHQRAKTFMLYQTKKPILLEDKPLFEISVLDSDSYSKLEIPLTTMKVRINEYNVKYVFMFCKSFYAYKEKGEEFDFDILKRMLDKIDVIIYPHKNGLYDVRNDFDKGELNDEIIKFIKTFEDFDKNLPQFLATHIEDPFRILYRLPEKNMKKNDKIKKFLKDELDKKDFEWIFDSKQIDKYIKLFCEQLGEQLLKIYKEAYVKTMDIKKSILFVDSFLNGISFNRIEIDYNMLGETGKTLLKMLFNRLIKEIGKENIVNLENDSKILKFLKFFINK
jgi:hypothetical protein